MSRFEIPRLLKRASAIALVATVLTWLIYDERFGPPLGFPVQVPLLYIVVIQIIVLLVAILSNGFDEGILYFGARHGTARPPQRRISAGPARSASSAVSLDAWFAQVPWLDQQDVVRLNDRWFLFGPLVSGIGLGLRSAAVLGCGSPPSGWPWPDVVACPQIWWNS